MDRNRHRHKNGPWQPLRLLRDHVRFMLATGNQIKIFFRRLQTNKNPLLQVERLDSTWHMLRQKYTDSAFNFEAKLRPTLKNMNSCSNPQAPNTTIPHLLPLILLQERTLEDFTTPTEQSQLISSCLGLWESNTQDFGLTTLLNHLETARKYMDTSASYQRNAEIVLGEARMEELTIDMFKTEFQMKFLWGSRGAFVPADERHSKFEQVLSAIADKYCGQRDDAEE